MAPAVRAAGVLDGSPAFPVPFEEDLRGALVPAFDYETHDHRRVQSSPAGSVVSTCSHVDRMRLGASAPNRAWWQ